MMLSLISWMDLAWYTIFNFGNYHLATSSWVEDKNSKLISLLNSLACTVSP